MSREVSREIMQRYWGAVGVIDACKMAIEYKNEFDNESISRIPGALELALIELNRIGLSLVGVDLQYVDTEGAQHVTESK